MNNQLPFTKHCKAIIYKKIEGKIKHKLIDIISKWTPF